jgi:hypothetical protein
MNLFDATIQLRKAEQDARMIFAHQLVQSLSAVSHDPLLDYGIPELTHTKGIKIAQYNDNPELNLYLMFYDGWMSLDTGKYVIKSYWVREQNGFNSVYNPRPGVKYEVASYDNHKKGRDYTFHCNSLQDTPSYIDMDYQISKMFKSLLRSYKQGKRREAKSKELAEQQAAKYNQTNGHNTNTTTS